MDGRDSERTAALARLRDRLALSKPDYRRGSHMGVDVADVRDLLDLLDEVIDLWRQEIALGTTQGGGRRYNEHCALHERANQLVALLDRTTLVRREARDRRE